MTTSAKPVVLDHEREGADALMGAIFAAALLTFMLSIGWVFVDFGIPLFQLPLLLLTFILVVVSGFLYFLNPAKFLTFFLIGLVYFSFEATMRSGSGGGDAQSMLKGVFTLALATLGVFTGLRSIGGSPVSLAFFAYALFALCSAAYSPQVLVGSVAGIALVGVAIISAKVGGGTRQDVRSYWNAIYWATVLTGICSLIYFAALPQQARDFQDLSTYRLRGITGTANSLGPLMAVGCIVALLMLRTTTSKWAWRFHALMLVLFAVLLVLTNSRSSILGLIVAYGVSRFVGGQWGVIRVICALIGLTLMAMVLFYPGLQEQILSVAASAFARSGSVNELTSFTGRKAIWDASWRLIGESPWVGYGLSSVMIILPKAHADQWGNTVATAHNLLLESLLTVGWLGTIPLVGVVLVCLVRLTRRVYQGASELLRGLRPQALEDQAMAECALRCLLMMMVQGFSEKAFAGHPGSPFLALGAVVTTAIYLGRHALVSDRMNKQAVA